MALVLPVLLVACGKDVPVRPSPEVTQAIFDPSAGRVPRPTDLVKDPATGLLKVPVADASTDPAQAYFDSYLNTLTGYPVSATAEVYFDGEIDPLTVTKDTIPIFEMPGAGSGATAPVQVTDLVYQPVLDPATQKCGGTDKDCTVRIFNFGGWKRGTQYVGLVRGGNQGVIAIIDGQRHPVVRSATFEMVTGPAPLCAWEANRSMTPNGCELPAPGATASGCCTFNYSALIDSQVKKTVRAQMAGRPSEEVEAEVKKQILISATQLEKIRRGYGALLSILAPASGGSLSREEVVLVWNFTTVSGNEAVFDPSATPARVPTPTDLAKDPTSGLLNVPDSPTASPAEKEFNAYLRSIDGFPTSTSSTVVELIGELDTTDATALQSMLAANLLVYEVGATGLTQVPATELTFVYDPAGQRLIIQRQGGFPKRGTTYAFFAMGGAGGLKGKDGQPVHRSALMHLALSPYPLCTFDETLKACTEVKVSSFIDDPPGRTGGATALAKATRFEMLRRGYDPALKAFEATGKKRDQIAAFWTFTTVSMTEVIYDPSAGVIPFPNNLLLDAAKMAQDPPVYQVAIPASAGESPAEKALREGLNTLDGFSTQGRNLAPVSGPVDPASLGFGTGVIAFDLQASLPVGMDFTYDATASAIVARPPLPLAEKTMHGIVLISRLKPGDPKPTSGLKDDKGRRLIPSVFTVLIRNRHPLVEGGKSTIPSLDLATATLAEGARLAHKQLFDGLEANPLLPVPREDIVAAWTFRTMTITDDMVKLRAMPYQILGTVDANQPKWTGAFAAPPATLEASVAGIATGTFTGWNALDEAGTGAFLPDPTKGKPAAIPFLLAVPCAPGAAKCTRTAARPAAGWPVVLYVHGTYDHKGDALLAAGQLAADGYAVLSFDFPYHGQRAWCAADAHCVSPGTCAVATGTCSTSLADTDSDGNPDASGARLGAMAGNPFALRDIFRQMAVDGSALLRSLRLGGFTALTGVPGGQPLLDSKNVHLLGQSLGAIIGTVILATDDVPRRANLNVAGAPIGEIVFESTLFEQVLKGLLAALKITAGSYTYQRLIATYTWVIDKADPGNFAAYLSKKQLPNALYPAFPGSTQLIPKKEVILQTASNDKTVPKKFGDYLGAAIGIDPAIMTKTTFQNQEHGFLLEPKPDANATKAAQQQTSVFFTAGTVCTPNLTTGTCQ